MAVHGVMARHADFGPAFDAMGDDLVAEKVEIDPVLGASALRTAHHLAIEAARRIQVVHREGDVEGPDAHDGLRLRAHP